MNHLLAGGIGGAIMWGEDNPVNSQINMYILSRVSWGLVRTAVRKGWCTTASQCADIHSLLCARVPTYKYAYQIYAGVIWAFVMYLFEWQKGARSALLPLLLTADAESGIARRKQARCNRRWCSR